MGRSRYRMTGDIQPLGVPGLHSLHDADVREWTVLSTGTKWEWAALDSQVLSGTRRRGRLWSSGPETPGILGQVRASKGAPGGGGVRGFPGPRVRRTGGHPIELERIRMK